MTEETISNVPRLAETSFSDLQQRVWPWKAYLKFLSKPDYICMWFIIAGFQHTNLCGFELYIKMFKWSADGILVPHDPTCMKRWLSATESQTLERFLFDLQLITYSQTCLTSSYWPIKLHWQLWLVHFRAGRNWNSAVSRNTHRSKLTSSLSASIFVFTWNESCTVSWPYSVCWAGTSHAVLVYIALYWF